jgi:hypothetical protein
MFKQILIILINVFIINNQVITSQNSRSWLYPCSEGQCLGPIESCLQKECIGVEQCTDCVTKESFTCKSCINELFNKLNLVNNELICSINDPLQEKVCEMYCRGKFMNKSKCERNENQISLCLCLNDKETTTATLKPSTTLTTKEINCKHTFKNFIFNFLNLKILEFELKRQAN